MAADIRWITEAEVVQTVDLFDAIEVIESALPAQANGDAVLMEKAHIAWGNEHTLHALGAAWTTEAIVGVKSWAHVGGAQPLLTLWDGNDGGCRAIIEAFGLGQLRTAAMSAIATRWLAPLDPIVLGVIGSGRQALAQVMAVAAVRAIDRVQVYSPTQAHRERFADRLKAQLQVEVIPATSVSSSVRGTNVVLTVTRSTSPFLYGDDLAQGVHINAVGAITPERAELHQSVIARCNPIVTDSIPSALSLAAELGGQGQNLQELATVVAGRRRATIPDLSLFKPMGLGFADIALGVAVLRRVGAGGKVVSAPIRVEPGLRRALPTRDPSFRLNAEAR